ncbi:transposase [Kitasatospora sp. NPDC058063]|uniref:transposase n=1 Tax=unclassified Kitasatospora TaxID=2633591 RepID=UPI0036DD5A40
MLRHDQRLLDLAGGNSVPESTLRRWRDEMIDLLAAKAPRLDRALRRIAARGEGVVLIDGTLIPTQRRTGKANRPNYSGKHRRHGLHFLALTDEQGKLIRISAARPRPADTGPSPHSPPHPEPTTTTTTTADGRPATATTRPCETCSTARSAGSTTA